MSNYSLSALNVNNMTINNLFALCKSSYDAAIPVRLEIGGIPNAILTQGIIDNNNLGQQINKNQKSGLTVVVIPLDKDRDNIQGEINRGVTFHGKSSNPAKKAAAETLKLFLTPYWDAATLPLNTQTEVITKMLVKYNANPALVAAAVTIGLDETFTALGAKNTEFESVYLERHDEVSAHEVSGSSLKPADIASYMQFCTAMEQAANFTPNDAIITLFNKLDTYRKTYHALEGGGKDAGVEGTK